MNEDDLTYLRRAVELAAEALDSGDEPFGSLLVSADGEVLAEDRNRVAGGDGTQHPEFALARLSTSLLTPRERATATVYTSTEHCPMCAAASGWVGLGHVVYASSSAQIAQWLTELAAPLPPVRTLPIGEIAPDIQVAGPSPELTAEIRTLFRRFHGAEG
ncbi:nucleoside deaminase [Streptomyces xiaopingdaonensis]|uniref:nucleoside deaminase n=1 Tax=Streptomyces xiaopingdaonensis TaxID=1565415 RepID=UPI0003020BAA|nr:nucleoside deaminase [Streptomyces xiaopingdaonensis]